MVVYNAVPVSSSIVITVLAHISGVEIWLLNSKIKVFVSKCFTAQASCGFVVVVFKHQPVFQVTLGFAEDMDMKRPDDLDMQILRNVRSTAGRSKKIMGELKNLKTKVYGLENDLRHMWWCAFERWHVHGWQPSSIHPVSFTEFDWMGNSIRHGCSFTCGFQASRGSTVRGNLILDLVLIGLKWVVHTLCVLNRQQKCQGLLLLNSDGGFASNVLLVFSLMYVYTIIWMVASWFTLCKPFTSVCAAGLHSLTNSTPG